MHVTGLAHPFMVRANDRYYAFFTAKHMAADTGGIALAESRNGFEWTYRRTVIREPFVTTHPFVFHWRGDYFLIPEAHTEPSVHLYRATSFPDQWTCEGNLLEGDTFIATTLVHYRDRWWMFTIPEGNDTLRLFYASDFRGPWIQHPRSPIVSKDLRTARPAGRPWIIDGTLYRLGQDCHPRYGYQVRAFEVTDITPTTYAEKLIEAPIVRATSNGWNAQAMHHVDAHQIAPDRWIAIVDALGA